jgi:hypothetical protein
LLGISDEKANQDIENLNAFGEEALESMNRIGIGYRDLRQYRRLPQDERIALIEAAKSGDKEELVELAEILLSKHAKEKEAITKRAEEAEADLEASRKRVAVKEAEAEKLTKALRRVEQSTPDEAAEDLRRIATVEAYAAEAAVKGNLRNVICSPVLHGKENNLSHDDFIVGLLCQIESEISSVRGEFQLKDKPDGDHLEEWLRPGFDPLLASKGLPQKSKSN